MKTQKSVTRTAGKLIPTDNALARFQALSQEERDALLAEAQGKVVIQFNPLEAEAIQLAADAHSHGSLRQYVKECALSMASSDVEVIRHELKRKASA